MNKYIISKCLINSTGKTILVLIADQSKAIYEGKWRVEFLNTTPITINDLPEIETLSNRDFISRVVQI